MLHKLSLFLIAWMVAGISWAAQPAFTVAEVELKAEPSNSASSLLQLAADTPVLILKRQGGWYQVQSGENIQSGWLKLHQLRYASEHTGDSDSFLALIQGSGSPTESTGVRGLSDAELKAGIKQSMGMQRVNRYHVSAPEARSFANRGALTSRQVSYTGGAQ